MIWRRIARTAAAAALALVPVAAEAQQAEASSCELHVWPGSKLNSVYYGWLHGGINNAAVNGNKDYPTVPRDPLSTEAQVTLLDEASPGSALALTGYHVTIHSDALASNVIRATPGRIGESNTPCYAELIVDDVFLQQDVFSGSYLKTLFRFRQFDGDGPPKRQFGTWVSTQLNKVSLTEKSYDLEAAVAEMRAAYRNNVTLFGQALNKPVKARK